MADTVQPDNPSRIALMQKLSDARNEDDDWTGLKDRAERRKRQNRLNVRAHRRRKTQQQSDRASPFQDGSQYLDNYQVTSRQTLASKGPGRPGTQSLLSLQQFTPDFLSERPQSSFNPLASDGTIILPLSRDHLIPLLHYNVLRAIMTNLSILALTNHVPRKRVPAICPRLGPLFPAPAEVPLSLAPTPLQLSTPHEVWIDLLPESTMRDNAIRYMNVIDNDELCRDIIGGHYEGASNIELTGIVVWNDPWCASGWEVTEGFVKKWGFLIKGCWEIINATNRWRELRGDDPLLFETDG